MTPYDLRSLNIPLLNESYPHLWRAASMEKEAMEPSANLLAAYDDDPQAVIVDL
ncbi:hypothetical protein BD309DRAFT_874541 [Dichomitus squalens]|uniref:Uncharacterized protein n=2 Tax=Dichomitus squalens TaxID=114155 RepID=A0A4Q9PY72_9APHY|nr:uncharacterized protein DICSQDRAFT_173991 [Dichomitus squalens LYAD-421 SS1]EJF57434.1 hypothetical protein DICSQDRAFT_173991 [Dichomitus squalens LYAD-421 SS1]TBU38358.1 hypothetical protein BD309DRAFT_874541 [Dichomitus squalens]TBU59575.1 hypothetical protein BD310DRAFT_816944 [Dichomitus squalens]